MLEMCRMPTFDSETRPEYSMFIEYVCHVIVRCSASATKFKVAYIICLQKEKKSV